jgi:tight adherence protein B
VKEAKMFGIDPLILVFMALAMLAVGGIAYALLYSRIEQERKTERRFNSIQREAIAETGKARRSLVGDGTNPRDAAQRRKSLEASIKQADKKRENRDQFMKKPPLNIQIKQSGATFTVQKFYVGSVICGVVVTLVALVLGVPLLYSPAVLIVGTLGLPRWWLGRKRKKRVAAFLNEFPNALDVLVRAVKSGLPLNDGIRMLGAEAQEPVRSEFQRIIDGQSVGKSTSQACLEMQETMPTSEAAFFGIVIQIQSQAGGNLSEALGNLSKVLRDRKKMKAKIQALSMEAKASAYIIGAMPFIVGTLVYLSSPSYIMPLFTTSSGHITLAISGVWMSIGIFVMKQMINFDI